MESISPFEWLSVMLSWLSSYFRPIIKGFLRLTTRLCELQRVCYGEPPGAQRTLAVEYSLNQSRNKDIHLAVKKLDTHLENGHFDQESTENMALDSAVSDIVKAKQIKKELHKQFTTSLRFCLGQIWGYKKMLKEIEELRAESYDEDNLRHEKTLLKLWQLLQPGIPLEKRKTKDWQNIGFQGEDPKTDFRGMGMLGLENLIYFCSEYNRAAKYLLSHSHHPNYGYSFAIVGINITHMAYKLVKEGAAKSHMFNVSLSKSGGKPVLENFHHFYSFLFVEFDRFWLQMKPENIMAFNRIRDLFESRIRDELKKPETCFKIQLSVDNV